MTEIAELGAFRPPLAPMLPAAAVARLPRGELGVPELDDDPFWRLVAAFLVECRRAQNPGRPAREPQCRARRTCAPPELGRRR